MDMNKPFRDNKEQTNRPADTSYYKLTGAELSYLPIKKDRFKEIMFENNVSVDHASLLWKYYIEDTAKVFAEHTDALRPAGGELKEPEALTRETLANLSSTMDRTDFDNFCSQHSIDPGVANDLFIAYSNEIQTVGEQAIEAQEALEEEQTEKIEEAVEEIDTEHETYTTPEEARAFIRDIKANPNHAYNSDKATAEEHEKAVDSVNRLIAISLGQHTNLDNVHDETDAKYHPKIVDRSSSNASDDNRPNKSYGEQETIPLNETDETPAEEEE